MAHYVHLNYTHKPCSLNNISYFLSPPSSLLAPPPTPSRLDLQISSRATLRIMTWSRNIDEFPEVSMLWITPPATVNQVPGLKLSAEGTVVPVIGAHFLLVEGVAGLLLIVCVVVGVWILLGYGCYIFL